MSNTSDLPVAEGGSPILTETLPKAVRWGEAELENLRSMVGQSSLFYWNGPQTNSLLEAFREHYPLKYCAPCSSGTAALHMAVASLEIAPGDEIIMGPITDMGSMIGVLYQQGVPVFADLEPHTYNVDPADVRRKITDKTRAIMAIHLAGNPCRMDELMAIAKEHDLAVIEDCAQTWGALSQGRPVGTIGTLGCYSFNDFKHVSCGDGGMVATNDEKVGPSLQKWGDKNYDRVSGTRMPNTLAPNYRISEPESAVAAAQMGKLKHICERRHEVGTRITRAIGDAPGVIAPEVVEGDWATYWFYMLRIDPGRLKVDRETFVAALNAEGLSANSGYIPAPVYQYPVFANHAFFAGRWPIREFGLTDMDYTKVSCPVAEEILETCLIIPVKEVMSDEYGDQCGQAIRRVAQYYAK